MQTTLAASTMLLTTGLFYTILCSKTQKINTSKSITSLSEYFGIGYTDTVRGKAEFRKIMLIGLQKVCSSYYCSSCKEVLLRSEFDCYIIRCYAVAVISSECRVLIMQFPSICSACFSSHDKFLSLRSLIHFSVTSTTPGALSWDVRLTADGLNNDDVWFLT
jgi:hypothetical protein